MERNLNNTNQTSNLEDDQQAQLHTHPEPFILSGSVANSPQPSTNRTPPVADPTTGFVPHRLSLGNCENPLPHGMTPYNAGHHHLPAGNFGPVPTPNFYNPHMNQGPQFIDALGGAYKSKDTLNHMAGPSSDMEVGSHRSVRLGSVGRESMLAHNPSHMIQGNHQGQAMAPVNGPRLDQWFSTNGGNGATWARSQAPVIPYMQGAGNMVPERYHGAAVPRSSINFQPYPPSMYPQGHPQALHHQPLLVQGPLYSQVPGPSFRPLRINPSHANVNPFQVVSTQMGPRYVGPVPPHGLGVYPPPQGMALVPGVVMRPHPFPHLRLLPPNEVAILEMGNTIDHHRDMRMDVDSMSYEELLALEEHIGDVETGLPENTISSNLETRTYISSATSRDHDDRETDFCTICQTNYENQDQIGTLECRHEFHVDCIKSWLVLKNLCPICKTSALTKRKDLRREG